MQIPANIAADLTAKAAELSGITDKKALFEAGLKALIERESAKRLAQMGSSDPSANDITRRRGKRKSPN